MAQTIQIKNGTGSSAPATLAQGELAINVSSGSLWYGSGSSNATKSSFTFGEITASNKILNHLGNHTGTGNISASGNVYAGRVYENGSLLSEVYATTTALGLKANTADPTFTGTVGGITKAMVGLTSAQDTADADKVISDLAIVEFATKADLVSPPFTGGITVTGAVSSSSTITGSGVLISPTKGIAVNTKKTGQGLTRADSNLYAYFTHYEYGQDASVSGSFVGTGNAGNNHQYNSAALGTFNHDEASDAAGGIEIGISQITMSAAQYIHPCYTVPFDCELVGFTGTLHRFGGSHIMSAGLFVAATQFGSNAATKMTLRAFATASSGIDSSYNQRNNHWEDMSQTYQLLAGDKVWAGVHCGDQTGDSVRAQFTMVFRHKIGME